MHIGIKQNSAHLEEGTSKRLKSLVSVWYIWPQVSLKSRVKDWKQSKLSCIWFVQWWKPTNLAQGWFSWNWRWTMHQEGPCHFQPQPAKNTNSVSSVLCDWPSLCTDGLISYKTQRNLNVPKHLAPFPWLSSSSQPTPAAHRTPALLQNCKDETIQPLVGGGHQKKTKTYSQCYLF